VARAIPNEKIAVASEKNRHCKDLAEDMLYELDLDSSPHLLYRCCISLLTLATIAGGRFSKVLPLPDIFGEKCAQMRALRNR
jgi:hypothetical protein